MSAPADDILPTLRAVRDEIRARVQELAASLRPAPAVGVIGGSGFYDLPGLVDVEQLDVETPFGSPSAPLTVGRVDGRRIVFLPRHGKGHHLLPSEVDPRANLHALKQAGVTQVVSVSAVGSLREHIAPGDVVLPRQFIDRTVARPSTFFGGGVVAHVSLADPVCAMVVDALAASSEGKAPHVHAAATYVCIEGPQFGTRAESEMFRAWGADVVGMTNLPEARLAREAELCYATLALATDYDCWRPRDEVTVSDALAVLRRNIVMAQRIVLGAALALDPARPCPCQRSLDAALVTQPEAIPAQARERLALLLARRVGAAS